LDKFVIEGANELNGSVTISGAKNAAVAILPAVILSNGICRIENLPNIQDVALITKILYKMGALIRPINATTIEIDPRNISSTVIMHEYARHMRASYYFVGALLGRSKKARVAIPGGCNFGVRPIDLHVKGFEALGCQVTVEGGMIEASTGRLDGNLVYMDEVSVGATINVMLAAVKANGLTVIENAAKEPHIVDLANFLNTMGADVRGAGTDVIKIHGVEELSGCTYAIIPDQIEAGTYMAAVAAAGGNILINNVIPKHLESITAKLEEMDVIIEENDDSIRVKRNGPLKKCNIKTMPHPGFPTDMQPQISVLLALAEGTSIVNENVWDHRFKYVDELRRMGAQVQVDGKIAVFEGVKTLSGAPVRALDLRAGAAMVIAGLAAKGTTEIEDIYHIDRGYDDVVSKLRLLGANIKRITIPQNVLSKAL